MPGKENDGPDEPDYGSTHNPFNPFQKIRGIEDAADTAKIGAIVSLWLALGPVLRLGDLLSGDQSQFPDADITDNVVFYSILSVNVSLLLVALLFTWVILQKRYLWAIVVVLFWTVVLIVAGAVSGGSVEIVSLVMMIIAIMSFRGALAMRRFRKQEAGSPDEG